MGDYKDKTGKTKIGKILQGIGRALPELATDVFNVITSTNPFGTAFDKLKEKLKGNETGSVGDNFNNELDNISENDKEVFLAALADVADARNSNVKIQESQFASWMAKNVPYILDLFVMLIWGSMTIFIIAKAINLVSDETIDWTAILGIYSGVTALATQVLSFHRGSSQGSKDKTKALIG